MKELEYLNIYLNIPLLCSWSFLAFSFHSYHLLPFLLCAVVFWPVLRASATVQPCLQQRGQLNTQHSTAPQPGRSQQQMLATKQPCPKGAFHAREAQKPYLRLLHMLGLHLLCLSTLFFLPISLSCVTSCPLNNLSCLFSNYVFAEFFRDRGWKHQGVMLQEIQCIKPEERILQV